MWTHEALPIPQILPVGEKVFLCGLEIVVVILLLNYYYAARGAWGARSQRGLGLDTALLAQRLAEGVEWVRALAAAAAGRQEVLALLALAHLLLHGDHLLLLGPAQREGDAEQQGRHRDGPHGAAGEEEDAGADALGRRVLAVEPGARRRRDDVAEGRQAVAQGLGARVEVGVVGDFGVCKGGGGLLVSDYCRVAGYIDWLLWVWRAYLLGGQEGGGEFFAIASHDVEWTYQCR